MSYRATVLPIMLASPSDTSNERRIVREAIYEWNIINSFSKKVILYPMGWDSHSPSEVTGVHPQKLINQRILEKCDLLIGVFKCRLGTPTSEESSGTVEEISKHITAGKPAMLYFCSNTQVDIKTIDLTQYKKLNKFKRQCQKLGIIDVFDSTKELQEKIFKQIHMLIENNPYIISTLDNNRDEIDKCMKTIFLKIGDIANDAIEKNRHSLLDVTEITLPENRDVKIFSLPVEEEGYWINIIEQMITKRGIISCAEQHYDIFETEDNEILIAIKYRRGKVQRPIVFYDGREHAIFIRNDNQIIVLDYIHQDVQRTLSSTKTILIAEFNGGSLIKKYLTPVYHIGELSENIQAFITKMIT